MVKPPVIDAMSTVCLASTARSVPTLRKSRTEYGCGRKFDDDETKKITFHRKAYYKEASRRQKIILIFFALV